MVCIHGGGYIQRSSVAYPGYAMAAREKVIIVTLNYRLDIFGFLTLGNNIIPGNMGLMDQNLALQWVQDNIGQFGGDKDKVTIFGQSVGVEVSACTSSARALRGSSRGLYHRAGGNQQTPHGQEGHEGPQ